MLEDEYFVLDKAVRSDPLLASEVGLREVRDRISSVAMGAGLANIDLNEPSRARRHAASGTCAPRLSPQCDAAACR